MLRILTISALALCTTGVSRLGAQASLPFASGELGLGDVGVKSSPAYQANSAPAVASALLDFAFGRRTAVELSGLATSGTGHSIVCERAVQTAPGQIRAGQGNCTAPFSTFGIQGGMAIIPHTAGPPFFSAFRFGGGDYLLYDVVRSERSRTADAFGLHAGAEVNPLRGRSAGLGLGAELIAIPNVRGGSVWMLAVEALGRLW